MGAGGRDGAAQCGGEWQWRAVTRLQRGAIHDEGAAPHAANPMRAHVNIRAHEARMSCSCSPSPHGIILVGGCLTCVVGRVGRLRCAAA